MPEKTAGERLRDSKPPPLFFDLLFVLSAAILAVYYCSRMCMLLQNIISKSCLGVGERRARIGGGEHLANLDDEDATHIASHNEDDAGRRPSTT